MSNEKHTVSRRRFLRNIGVITTGILLDSKHIFAQAESPVITIRNEAAKSAIKVTPLRGNIHVLEGSGGNIAVFTGTDGKLMVDAGIAVSQQKILAEMNKISAGPLKYLINSHWHFDHADGNKWVHDAGATIIAHEKTRENLSKTIRVEDWNYTFPGTSGGALPTVVFQQAYMLRFNGSEIQMSHYEAAHTNSDISIYFPNADVLHVGDTWWNSYYPFIDHSSGGTLDGMIKAADHNLKITTDKTIIIPGHGDIGNRSQLSAFRDMLLAVKDNISKLKKSGRTLNETIAAKPTAAYDAKFGNFVVNGAFFTRLVYADV
jgi:glyoxylase-like metal-dependent hydrolase (beta-lactamase superfamily II)